MTVFDDYTRARIGFFFGLSGPQLATVVATALPVFVAISMQAWTTVLGLLLGWATLTALVVIPLRGRPATHWLLALVRYTVGRRSGRIPFRARAGTGTTGPLDEPDLPGVLSALQVHDGPPTGPAQKRWAVVQNHATRTWSMTATITHPGIGMADQLTRDRDATGLASVLDLASRTELIDEILMIVRTVPDDGAERAQWITDHRRSDGPPIAARVNDDLHHTLASASVRTETYLTFVVPEHRLAKPARESGGRLDGRARVLYLLAAELEAQLRGPGGMTDVTWLTSPELAVTCRTGFAPGDRSSIIDTLTTHPQQPAVAWALAGPSGADQTIRHYSHDAWNSISAAVSLPDNGAVMGAIAPVMTPTEPGERRSVLIAYPILDPAQARRRSASTEWSADLGDALRDKAKVKQRTRARTEANRARALDHKLAHGRAMIQPYVVATVTAPKTTRISEHGRRLDAAIRRSGFHPLRLDLAHDIGLIATTIPLGISLTRGNKG